MYPPDGHINARAVAEMTRRLRPRGSVRHTLDQIVALAVEMGGGRDAAGVILVHRRNARRRTESAAATGELVARVDSLQCELGEGPSLTAMRDDLPVAVDDMAAEQRWPAFAPAAGRLGVASAVAFRLFVDDDTLGALNLWSRRRYAFDVAAREVGTVLAAQAAVALTEARTEAQLLEAIRTRQVIGQALGIVMERRHVDADEAFTLLRRASQERNVKLRDLANDLARSAARRPCAAQHVDRGDTGMRHVLPAPEKYGLRWPPVWTCGAWVGKAPSTRETSLPRPSRSAAGVAAEVNDNRED